MGPESDAPDGVKLLNPLASNEAWLRAGLLPGLRRQAELNWREQVRSVRLFEIGTVFQQDGKGRVPLEERRVAAVVSGRREPEHWTGSGADYDGWDLKGLFQAALSLAVPAARVQVEGNAWVGVTPEGDVVGRAERLAADAPPWAAPLFGFEIEIDPATRTTPRIQPPSATPASERDIALVVPAGVSADQMEDAIRQSGGTILESVRVIDEYRGEKLPPDVRSVVFRLVYRAPERTLEKAEVDQAVARVLKTLEKELRVHIRET
jgi:phenylalanyl-tRNA synthetase beta chain